MGSDLEPDVRNEATNEIRHQYLSAGEGARELLGWRPLFTLDEGLRAHDRLVPGLPGAGAMSDIACRAARAAAAGLTPVLSLGETPLANALLDAGAARPSRSHAIPLDLVFCPRCALVQITETVPPEMLFRDYLLLLVVLRHDAASTRRRSPSGSSTERGLGADSLVVEIASNDGYLLQYYVGARRPGAGHRAGRATSRGVAEERGVRTLVRVLRRGARAPSSRAEGTRADVIHANNVLAHVPDLNGVRRRARDAARRTTASR